MRNALLIFCSMMAVIVGGCRTATDTMDDDTASTSGTYGTSGTTAAGTTPTSSGGYGTTGTTASGTTGTTATGTPTSTGGYGTTGTTATGTTSTSTGGYGTTGTTGSTTPGTGTYGASTAAPAQVQVSLTDYRIDMPDTLPAGRTRFYVVNYGRVDHSFGIRSSEADTAYGGTAAYDRRMAVDLMTNQSSYWDVDLQPGTYTAYCPVRDHATAHQMVRLVTVR